MSDADLCSMCECLSGTNWKNCLTCAGLRFAAAAPTLDEVERLFGLMKAADITECEYRGMRIKRNGPVEAPKTEKTPAEDIEKFLGNMTPDTVDRWLMLKRTKGNV